MNKLVESGSSEVFGAPVLSASTNGAAVIEDPAYNPAQAPTQTTPITTQDDGEGQTVIISDEAAISVTATTAASMVFVIIVVALLVLCCAGIGTMLVCAYQVHKNSKQVKEVQQKHAQAIELKKQGMVNASESQIEVDQQYVMPEDMDIDIFSKKRQMKINHGDAVEESQRSSVTSERNLVNDSATKMIKKQTKVPTKVTKEAKNIVSGIKTVKR